MMIMRSSVPRLGQLGSILSVTKRCSNPNLLSRAASPSPLFNVNNLVSQNSSILTAINGPSRRGFHSSSCLGQGQPQDLHETVVLPPLMANAPFIFWPSLILTIKNWIFNHLVLKPYLDKEFDLKEFEQGARHAVAIVSEKISKGQFDDLQGLLTKEAIEEIKINVSKFSVFQRQLLPVALEDIIFSFPYQIGIIIPEQSEQDMEQPIELRPPQKRYVEIMVVIHTFRGYHDKLQKGEVLQGKSIYEFSQTEEARLNTMICNYRFFKDFTKNSSGDGSWIINLVNQFLPVDYAKRRY